MPKKDKPESKPYLTRLDLYLRHQDWLPEFQAVAADAVKTDELAIKKGFAGIDGGWWHWMTRKAYPHDN